MRTPRARMAVWCRIWLMAVKGERPGHMMTGSVALVLAALIGAWFGQLDKLAPFKEACRIGGVPLALLAGLWWAAFCGGAVRQNSPANALLVPGLNRAVRECAVLVWVGTMAAMLPLAYSHPDGAMVYPQFAIALTSVGLILSARKIGYAGLGALAVLYAIGHFSPPFSLLLAQTATVTLASVCAFAFAAWGLPRALPVAGDQHCAMGAKLRASRAQYDMVEWEKSRRGSGRNGALYTWLLARDCSANANPGDMMLHGLGPRTHRFFSLPFFCILLPVALLVKPVLQIFGLPADQLIMMVGSQMALGAIWLIAVFWARFSYCIRSTPQEQALLRLAPGLPSSASWNKVLGRRIISIITAEAVIVATVALAGLLLLDVNDMKLRATLTAFTLMLTGAGFSLDDYARRAKHGYIKSTLFILWLIVLIPTTALSARSPVAWSAGFTLIVATVGTFIMMRWRRMQRGAVAFPSGRMD